MESNWVRVNYGSKKIFETEISAYVGCALATPNFLDLASTNPVTSSLNRIFVTFFLEKKSGGKPGFPPPPAAKSVKILDFDLGCVKCFLNYTFTHVLTF